MCCADPPCYGGIPLLKKGDPDMGNARGITFSFPENDPAQFPVHTPDEMHELIACPADWESELAKGICKNQHHKGIFCFDRGRTIRPLFP